MYTEWKVLQPLMAVFKPQFSPECKARQEVKAKQWELHFAEYGRGVSIYRTTEIAKLVLQGIPDSLRREVWMTFSGQLGFRNPYRDHNGESDTLLVNTCFYVFYNSYLYFFIRWVAAHPFTNVIIQGLCFFLTRSISCNFKVHF